MWLVFAILLFSPHLLVPLSYQYAGMSDHLFQKLAKGARWLSLAACAILALYAFFGPEKANFFQLAVAICSFIYGWFKVRSFSQHSALYALVTLGLFAIAGFTFSGVVVGVLMVATGILFPRILKLGKDQKQNGWQAERPPNGKGHPSQSLPEASLPSAMESIPAPEALTPLSVPPTQPTPKPSLPPAMESVPTPEALTPLSVPPAQPLPEPASPPAMVDMPTPEALTPLSAPPAQPLPEPSLPSAMESVPTPEALTPLSAPVAQPSAPTATAAVDMPAPEALMPLSAPVAQPPPIPPIPSDGLLAEPLDHPELNVRGRGGRHLRNPLVPGAKRWSGESIDLEDDEPTIFSFRQRGENLDQELAHPANLDHHVHKAAERIIEREEAGVGIEEAEIQAIQEETLGQTWRLEPRNPDCFDAIEFERPVLQGHVPLLGDGIFALNLRDWHYFDSPEKLN